MAVSNDATQARRAALIEAARGVFLRYGFKKTSMDDLARAAQISRQGLYLHFATKEELFREVVALLVTSTREASSQALAREDRSAEERLFGAFEVVFADEHESEHISELLEAASEQLGGAIEEHEKGFLQDLVRTIKATGVAASWDHAGITPKALAEHLLAASHGLKKRRAGRTDYLNGMRTAVRIICRGGRKSS